jgi:GPH family glycoside/pentoside/hexuronide:cation symporter
METKLDYNLTKKHLFGYAFGDLGGCMTFAILGSFLLPYYTDVAGISPAAVAVMFLIIKIWDAINDPMMGAIMDKAFVRSKHKMGKFRPWMLRATPLLLITAVMMYTVPGVLPAGKLLAAYVTYLLYEASYTMFNIPYGTLLSAMAGTEGERAKLSSARGFGAMIGNIIPLMLFPIIITVFKNNQALGYGLGVTVSAVIGFVFCLLSVYWTSELQTKQNSAADVKDAELSDIKFTDILVVFRKNRAFVALFIAGLLSCLAQYTTSTLGVYMFRDVLGSLPLMSMSMFLTMGFSAIVLLLAPKLVKKFGIIKLVTVSLLIGILLYVALYFASFAGAWVYLIVSGLAGCFVSVPVLMQWGMVGDSIDYNEMVTGKRTEGSMYGTFNLSRRIGQAVGTSFAAFMLGVIGYTANATAQSTATVTGIRLLIVGIPLVSAVGSWIALRFIWNITPEVREKMAAYRASKYQGVIDAPADKA